jgi:hypothetical protein
VVTTTLHLLGWDLRRQQIVPAFGWPELFPAIRSSAKQPAAPDLSAIASRETVPEAGFQACVKVLLRA